MEGTKQGFTLVELLVTVAIIAVLAALLAGATMRAIAAGQSAKCIANLHALSGALGGYLNDHDNCLPQRFYPQMPGLYGYNNELLPYAGDNQKAFLCPARENPRFPNEPSYGMNWYYDNVNMATVELPSRTIFLAEANNNGSGGSHRADRDSRAPGQLDPERHFGKSNFLFLDGHVATLTYEQTISPEDLWGYDHHDHDRTEPR